MKERMRVWKTHHRRWAFSFPFSHPPEVSPPPWWPLRMRSWNLDEIMAGTAPEALTPASSMVARTVAVCLGWWRLPFPPVRAGPRKVSLPPAKAGRWRVGKVCSVQFSSLNMAWTPRGTGDGAVKLRQVPGLDLLGWMILHTFFSCDEAAGERLRSDDR